MPGLGKALYVCYHYYHLHPHSCCWAAVQVIMVVPEGARGGASVLLFHFHHLCLPAEQSHSFTVSAQVTTPCSLQGLSGFTPHLPISTPLWVVRNKPSSGKLCVRHIYLSNANGHLPSNVLLCGWAKRGPRKACYHLSFHPSNEEPTHSLSDLPSHV